LTDLTGKRVELTTDDGVTTFLVEKVEYPYLYGIDEATNKQSRIDLQEIHALRVRGPDTAATIALTAVIVLVVLAGAAAIAWSQATFGTTN
jgi:hypothetical protein